MPPTPRRPVRRTPSPTVAATGPSPVDHIVIVLQENHTFDNHFGTYPSAEGTLGKPICLPNAPGSAACTAPYHETALTPVELSHNWKSAHAAFDLGRMDGFVYTEGNPGTMGYFDRTDLPRYWKAADQYVLCDRYFTSVMSESAPNHLFLVAGTSGEFQDDNVPAAPPFPPVFEQLDRQGISWRVYGFTQWYNGSPTSRRPPGLGLGSPRAGRSLATSRRGRSPRCRG